MRQKLQNKNIRKISRIGNHSLGITIPVEIVKELGWREKQKVTVRKYGRGFLIKDWKK